MERERPYLVSSSNDAIHRIASAFREAGFTWAAVRVLLDLPGGWVQSRDIPYFARRLNLRRGLDMLAALFVLGLPLPEGQARDCLGVETIEALIQARLLAHQKDGLHANVAITPFEGLLLAHDWWPSDASELPYDHVMGVSPVSMTLAAMTPRKLVGLTADIGTGCGLQALLAARHSRVVIASDINERALNYARFNCRLNGVTNIVLLRSSFFDPMVPDSVDLIVCNPPFVISPGRRYVFRDGGGQGDQLSREILVEALGHLRVGGWASILIDWIHDTDTDWADRLHDWLRPLDVAAWLLRIGTMDPLKYAAAWNRDWADGYGALLDEWNRYLHGLRVKRISSAAVVMHRLRTGAGARYFSETFAGFLGPAPQQISAVFGGQGVISSIDEIGELRDRTWRFSAVHRLVSERSTDSEESRHTLAWTTGLPLTTDITELVHATGDDISAQAFVELAAANPQDPMLSREVRELLGRGFIAEEG
jgi:SAM-dependent methyltransferase